MRTKILLWTLAFAGLFWVVQAIDQAVNFSGTWILDPSRSDMGAPSNRRGFPRGSVGIGLPGGIGRGGGYPGGGSPGGGYPGGGYPGGGYPGGSNPTGGYPGGGRPGGNYPGGRDDEDPAGNPSDKNPGRGGGITPLTDVTLVIRQVDQQMEVKHQFQIEGKEEEVVQTFSWQGGQTSNPDWLGQGTFVCRTSWEKNKLLNLGFVKASTSEGDREIVVREEYSLADKGNTLIIKIKRQTPRGEISSKRVFTRR